MANPSLKMEKIGVTGSTLPRTTLRTIAGRSPVLRLDFAVVRSFLDTLTELPARGFGLVYRSLTDGALVA